jgi:DNA-binding transcriptional regulator YhcF (GntR family)
MRNQSDKSKGVQPDNMATIEHVYSRLNPQRYVFTQGEKRHILSCYKCNHEKGREETMTTFRDRHVKKSQNGHKNLGLTKPEISSSLSA